LILLESRLAVKKDWSKFYFSMVYTLLFDPAKSPTWLHLPGQGRVNIIDAILGQELWDGHLAGHEPISGDRLEAFPTGAVQSKGPNGADAVPERGRRNEKKPAGS
jgi:hypothetical protein